MLFGHYQIATRHREFDETYYHPLAPSRRERLFAVLTALVRRFFH